MGGATRQIRTEDVQSGSARVGGGDVGKDLAGGEVRRRHAWKWRHGSEVGQHWRSAEQDGNGRRGTVERSLGGKVQRRGEGGGVVAHRGSGLGGDVVRRQCVGRWPDAGWRHGGLLDSAAVGRGRHRPYGWLAGVGRR
ncbi:hypothetical protein ZWY2020_035696 [Hordeum vulgare]|nr:hypothetical protein ZWY2020_035696 [Hordeum vulgare]